MTYPSVSPRNPASLAAPLRPCPAPKLCNYVLLGLLDARHPAPRPTNLDHLRQGDVYGRFHAESLRGGANAGYSTGRQESHGRAQAAKAEVVAVDVSM